MVTLYDGRRGCEKIENLRRDQWEKVHDDVWDFSFWQKVSLIFLKLLLDGIVLTSILHMIFFSENRLLIYFKALFSCFFFVSGTG